MARTPEADVLTRVHRQRQISLAAAVVQDLMQLWRAIVDPNDPSTWQRFAELAATLIGLRRRDSAGLAADYYRAFRTAEGVDEGAPTVVMAATLAAPTVGEQVRAAGLAGYAGGRRAGQAPEQAARNGLVRATGTATRMVLSGGRTTLVDSVRADRQALGWIRIVDANPCAFCAMLASRGPVYKSARTGGFQAHDHCGCTAEPVYRGSRLPAANARLERLWNEVTQGKSGRNALNAFRRHLEGRE
ncbi:VG15 protein [Thermomonospora cellulosilytica]|uniref:MuF-like minor capsid protein n=1 Tax=Thermomonospora cellulosilytica TaxID=1411118 RepID=A0A7W3MU90_9ACTN|nr:hypothetical protein [Thermomonospora cellulosilytica]MBA9002018.1 hypothetical protein [Thermomonospora cellulosilytica]